MINVTKFYVSVAANVVIHQSYYFFILAQGQAIDFTS